MLTQTKKALTLPLLLLIGHLAVAQQSPVSAGGTASGSTGTISFSIGQLVDDTYSSGGNTITSGVQQPYEISDPLPLKLLSFTAQLQGNEALLTWKTTHEQNVNHFEVEKRTASGSDFSSLATLNAKGGNGSELYQYTDHLLVQGVTYYRLKEVDNNGLDNYSQIVLVNLQSTIAVTLRVYPNPVVTLMTINFNAAENKTYQLQLIDGLGRTVLSKQVSCVIGNNSVQWNVAQLAAGEYTLKAVGTNMKPVKIIRN